MGLDAQMQAAFADEVRAAGREALVRIAREGSLEMVRQLADLGLMEDKRFDAQIELLRQGNRMDCVAFLMERRHRARASRQGRRAGRVCKLEEQVRPLGGMGVQGFGDMGRFPGRLMSDAPKSLHVRACCAARLVYCAI